MKRKKLLVLCGATVISTIFFALPLKTQTAYADEETNSQKGVYEKVTKLDLSKYKINVEGNNLHIEKKFGSTAYGTNNSFTKLSDNTVNEFNELIKDEGVKDYIKSVLSQGKEIGRLSTKTVYDEKVYENGKQVDDRLLTTDEVNNLDLNDDGSVATRPSTNSNSKGKLTLSISASDPSSNEHWVQAGASWNLKGFHGVNTSNSPGSGDDFIAVSWANKYCSKGNQSASGVYQGGGKFTPLPSQISSNSGIIWSFADAIGSSHYTVQATRVYAGVGIRNTGGSGYVGFTANYVHTWSDTKYSVSLNGSASGVSAGVSVSPQSSQWSFAVDTSDNFN